MKEDDDGDQEGRKVGYGNPPPSSRFKKGVSGNPKGRPKGTRNFQTELNEELKSKITVQENGKRKRITKRQAIAKQLVNKALGGELKAMPTLFNQSRDFLPEEQQLTAIFDTPDDKLVLAGLVERLKGFQANDPDTSED